MYVEESLLQQVFEVFFSTRRDNSIFWKATSSLICTDYHQPWTSAGVSSIVKEMSNTVTVKIMKHYL